MSLVNNQGRPYIRGKQLLPELSEHILCEYNNGFSPAEIARDAPATAVLSTVFERTVEPRRTGGSASSKVSDDVLQYMEISKLRKPSIFACEIREQIVSEGVCDLHECPSESAILWSTRNKLGMTWKKISQLL